MKPSQYFRKFAAVQARGPRAARLAEVLDRTDHDRLILCSFTGAIKNGHHETHEYSGDYDEAFQFWNGYEPPESVKKSQGEVARKLRSLAESVSSPTEGERMDYLARYVEFLVPYAESWSLAFRLNQILEQAAALKKQGNTVEAQAKVAVDGVSLWLKLAPLVREAFVGYQQAVSERNELGALASMHNKYERLALFRLRASMKEFLGELPPETENLFAEVRKADPEVAPRVFIPTRPTMLGRGEAVRVFAVATGGHKVERVVLFTRPVGSERWEPNAMNLVGRRTFLAEMGPRTNTSLLLGYYVQAEFWRTSGRVQSTAPADAPVRFYTLTVMT